MTEKEQVAVAEPAKGVRPLARNMSLGKYRLETCLGRGGYCEVWKARDHVEGIWVALKIPQADVHGKRDNQAVLREVRLVAQLRHPHIMPVKNAEIINGYAVLATELSVKTLEDCCRPMGFRRIVSTMSQVLEGLAYAHSCRMVHCDVTPGNIFLFPNGRAAIGDFGIGLKIKGRMQTVDEFGTPGYVAPEQAYGYPTYRSDCFAVGLILYEYITGVLPRWPFKWPAKGIGRLKQKTGNSFVMFMKKTLSVSPEARFANAHDMLLGLRAALPRSLSDTLLPGVVRRGEPDWRKVRRDAFVKRYRKTFGDLHSCVDCNEPLSERMEVCPWCGSDRNRFDNRTVMSHVCHRCHRGVLPEWNYCPWCYGEGFEPQSPEPGQKTSYQGNCKHCGGKVMRFMRYCPWCNRKIRRAWTSWPLPEVCRKCGWSVDSNYWNHCPWCRQQLI